MKRTVFCMALVVLLCAAIRPALPQQEGWASVREDIEIPMRDGKSLAADLYLPLQAAT